MEVKMTPNNKKWDLSHFPLSQIKSAIENDLIYDSFGIANEDDYDLTISIRDNGIQEPLVLSADFYLLSGHRRKAAATYLNLKEVPVRLTEIFFEDLTTDERLKELRIFNRQRSKSSSERIREKLLEVDSKLAYTNLLRKRAEINEFGDDGEINIELETSRKRSVISTMGFLNAAKKVINENKAYWPLTVRRVHYLLLNDPPLKHDKKPHSKYINDKNSYKALTNLLLRARLNRFIPMQAIEDGTRPIRLGGGFQSLEQFIEVALNNFLMGYSRNLMQGQQNHIEIILEKNALRSVIEIVAKRYCIPMTTARGYASLSPRHAIATRFKNSGKNKLVLLMLTDFDPDGEQIAESFARSMRDDFGITDIHPVKVALTAEDVENYDLPSDMDAKPSSPNYQKFIKKYGIKAVELDAAPVKLLQQKLENAVESVIDIDEYNSQIELEEEDATEIEARRSLVFEAIKDSL